MDRQLFYWDYQQNKFQSAEEFRDKMTVKELVEQGQYGLSKDLTASLKETFGENSMKIEIQSVFSRCKQILSSPLSSFEIIFLVFLYALDYHSYFLFLRIFLLYQFVVEVARRGAK